MDIYHFHASIETILVTGDSNYTIQRVLHTKVIFNNLSKNAIYNIFKDVPNMFLLVILKTLLQECSEHRFLKCFTPYFGKFSKNATYTTFKSVLNTPQIAIF